MAKRKKSVQQYTAVMCASGKGHVIWIGLAPLRQGPLLGEPRAFRCPVCGNNSLYQADHFFVTAKAPPQSQ